MNSRIAAFDRIIVLVVGLVLLFGGLWSIGLFFDIALAQQMADRIDSPIWLTAPDQQWFEIALIAALVVSTLLGYWLISWNLRRYRINRVSSPASGPTGSIEMNLATLAATMSAQLESHPSIDTVKHSVAVSWGRPTMTLTVQVGAGVDLVWLRTVLEKVEEDFRAATPGIDMDTIYRVHLAAIDI